MQMLHVLLKARQKAMCDERRLNTGWGEVSEAGLGVVFAFNLCSAAVFLSWSLCSSLKDCVAVLLAF